MQTCSTGKKSVTICHMTYIFFCSTSCHNCTGTTIFPNINIFLCVESDYPTPCRTTCGLHSHTFRQWYTKKTIWILISQIIFCNERKFMKIFDSFYIFWLYSCFFHFIAIKFYMIIYIFYLLYKSFTL